MTLVPLPERQAAQLARSRGTVPGWVADCFDEAVSRDGRTSITSLCTSSVQESAAQWQRLSLHSDWTRARAAGASAASTRMVRVPVRIVSTVTSNSATIVGPRRGGNA
jgi:hypothetical protein